MHLKLLSIVFAFGLFSVVSFAQKPNFGIQISLEQGIFQGNKKNIPVKVVITNKSEQALDTTKLDGINFYLSKCSKFESCDVSGDIFVAHAGIKSKTLQTNEFVEFEVNLADLYWNDMLSSFRDFKHPKNLNKVPFSNKYFYADVLVFDKYSEVQNAWQKFPRFESYKSNEIIQTFKLKK